MPLVWPILLQPFSTMETARFEPGISPYQANMLPTELSWLGYILNLFYILMMLNKSKIWCSLVSVTSSSHIYLFFRISCIFNNLIINKLKLNVNLTEKVCLFKMDVKKFWSKSTVRHQTPFKIRLEIQALDFINKLQIDSKYIQIGTLNFYAWKILDFEKKGGL